MSEGKRHSDREGVSRGSIYRTLPTNLTIVRDPKHAFFQPRALLPPDPGMIRSVDEEGILEPVSIVTDGPDLVVRFGIQRVQACLAANELRAKRGDPLREVPYLLDDSRGDLKKWFEHSVIENEHRQNLGPCAKANEIARAKGRGYTPNQIAHMFRLKNEAEIEKRLQILECSTKVQAAIDAGELPMTVVPLFAKMKREKQDEKLAKLLKRGEMGKKATRALRGDAPAGERAPRMLSRQKVERYLTLLEEQKPDGYKSDSAIVRFILGDENALEEWPDASSVARLALAPVAKERKAPKDAEGAPDCKTPKCTRGKGATRRGGLCRDCFKEAKNPEVARYWEG